MRTTALFREALASAWASKVPTFLILLVTAAMCFTTSATAGRNAALQQQLAARTQDAGARVITIEDLGDDGFLTPLAMGVIQELSTVETAAATTRPSTFTNATLGWGGPTVSGWGLLNNHPDDVLRLTRGRWPNPGEALVSPHAAEILRLDTAAGAIMTRDQHTMAIVGTFEAVPPFDWLDDGVVFVPVEDGIGREARVTVHELNELASTERAIREILLPTDPSKMRLESPHELADVTLGVGNDVRSAGYETTLVVLTAGALFVGAVTLTDVLIRRHDVGRRRALGITRFDLMVLICLRAMVSTVLGAIIGVIAVQAFGLITEAPTTLLRAIASATLVAISALLAIIPVGLVAARRDPVSVLRTP